MRLRDCKNSHFLALFYEFYFLVKSLISKGKRGYSLPVKKSGEVVKSYSPLAKSDKLTLGLTAEAEKEEAVKTNDEHRL